VAVLLDGRVAQVGSPQEVFRRPSGPEVAAFVGVGTVLHGLVQARESGLMRVVCGPLTLRAVGNLSPGTPVVLTIRSEEVELLVPDPGDRAADPNMPEPRRRDLHELTSARNELRARVVSIRPLGLTLLVELDAQVPLTAAITRPALEDLRLEPGREVGVRIKAIAVQVKSEAWGEPAPRS
jgi:molybdopterin-binding protein